MSRSISVGEFIDKRICHLNVWNVLHTVAIIILAIFLGLCGIQWSNQINTLEEATISVPIVNVYANSGTGNDITGDGTIGRPVQTLSKAVEILGKGTGQMGIINLVGNTPFNLGVDPEISFFPASAQYNMIRVVGVRSNVVVDTIDSLTQIPPVDTFQRINGTIGGYIGGLYETHFYENLIIPVDNFLNDPYVLETTVYAVSANDDKTVDVVGGLFEVGQEFTLFTVGETQIVWSGEFHLTTSRGNICFENIYFRPAIESYLYHPTDLSDAAIYLGCRFDLTHKEQYVGSMALRGAYIEGYTGFAFNRKEFDFGGIVTESVYMVGASILYGQQAHATYIYSVNNTDNFGAIRIGRSGSLYTYGIYIVDSNSNNAFAVFAAPVLNIRNLEIVDTQFRVNNGIFSGARAQVFALNVKITLNRVNSQGLRFGTSELFLSNSIIDCPKCLNAVAMRIHFMGVDCISSHSSGGLILQTTDLTLRNQNKVTNTNGYCVMLQDGSRLLPQIRNTKLNCTGTGIIVETGSSVINLPNTPNLGAGGDLQCGSNPISGFTTQNDLNQTNTQNCFCQA